MPETLCPKCKHSLDQYHARMYFTPSTKPVEEQIVSCFYFEKGVIGSLCTCEVSEAELIKARAVAAV